jgi:DNA-binding winged helix-turn-helix (wHTH) protein/TolB-like protein/Flp pilus assembly protein TadD
MEEDPLGLRMRQLQATAVHRSIVMSEPAESTPDVPELGVFRLGEWSVRQAEGVLCSGDRVVHLEPRVMDVLACLAGDAERVITKEELLAVVWDGAFVEEGALSQAIHSLRKALGDNARQPRYIQTIPKRGYRLVAPVIVEEPKPPPDDTLTRVPSAVPVGLTDPAPNPRRWLWPVVVAAVSLVVVVVLWLTGDRLDAIRQSSSESTTSGKPKIVVLPFESFGPTQDSYFALGLVEEITNDLASLPSLHVISRTSAMRVERGRKTLSQIGNELQVDYVLEGTVSWSRAGNRRVSVTPRLFRVADGTQIRAESFERGVREIFEVKAEISQWVLDQLDLPVPTTPRRMLPPTDHPGAYQAYIRGLEIRTQPFYSEEHIRLAVPMFERAVQLDPRFVAAWAELSQLQSYLAFNADPSPAQLERAWQPLKRALDLAPDHPDVRLAQAYFNYRCLGQYETAEKQLLAATRLFPNDARFLEPLAFVLRRRGRLGEAIEKLKVASSLDPLTPGLLLSIGETYRAMRKYEQADLYYDQATSMAPDQIPYWEEKALNRLAWTGDVEKAREVLEESPFHLHPRLTAAYFLLDFYEREYERALARLTPENLKALDPQTESRILTLAAIARERLGDRRGALAAAEANRAILAARVARFPIDPFHRGYLAVTLVQLGRKDEAMVHINKALQVFPDDAFSAPRIVEIQAMMESVLGHRREAIRRLIQLLDTPYQGAISATDVRLNPVWDSLQEDPSFKKLRWKL